MYVCFYIYLYMYISFLAKETSLLFFVRMPYLWSNMQSLIFYASIFSEFLRIARCTSQSISVISKMHSKDACFVSECKRMITL